MDNFPGPFHCIIMQGGALAQVRILGFIKWECGQQVLGMISPVHSTSVRPTEILHPALGTQHKKDMNLLDWIQRKATKMVTGMEYQPYEERLKELELSCLKEKRLKGGIIVAFQYLK